VEPTLLTEAERQWLNDYHRRVRDTLGPTVDEATRAWLDRATLEI
ncbi:MAG: M24 family metallopeptidase C-terminal domain-containing protein, partial [Reyranella sp.]|nr:M24 family metallopeptidase C-terminal domain-containing protein [Reyranella sp.]